MQKRFAIYDTEANKIVTAWFGDTTVNENHAKGALDVLNGVRHSAQKPLVIIPVEVPKGSKS